MKITFQRIAQDEYERAMLWYLEKSDILAERFVAAVENKIETIQNQPLMFPIVHRDIREAIVRGFPYCLYFTIKEDQILIVSVFHSARHPARWQNRN